MKEEVEIAIKKMKHGKATGPDNISVELIEALEDFGIGKVTHLLNKIYDTGQIPADVSKSNFIALPKKPANKRRSLVRTIRKRQATFLGHVIRRAKLKHLVTTGKFEGKRSRGRQREKIMDGLATWLGPGKVSNILAAVKDRDLWRDMIANAYKQGT
ncbi:hypothetical protein PoB_007323200 [Plakobranchus ocellatus]|uniref:Uncharacterized protein n=1 Tax=Plakobranchus ocellatus TaxID=259542 RepID=A0AAV4DQY9_9GAST|nr:hypothetical protein PoB_007323200 [Plakobranchus ocellatus]